MTKDCIAIDVGGTTISGGYYPSNTTRCLSQKSMPTEPGKEGVSNIMTQLIKDLSMSKKGSELVLAIGFPGNFSQETDYVVAPGSLENLSTIPGDWEGVNLKDYCEEIVAAIFSSDPPRLAVLVNDAIAQFVGAFYDAISTGYIPNHGDKYAFLGMGTGLGGGVGTAMLEKKDGTETMRLNLHTDGHLFDILFPDHEIAEQKLSGPSLSKRLTCELNMIHAIDELSVSQKKNLQEYIADLTYVMQVIHDGTLQKRSEWTPEETRSVKGTRHFFLGGGVGQKGVFSQYIIDELQLNWNSSQSLSIIPVENSKIAALNGLCYLSRKGDL